MNREKDRHPGQRKLTPEEIKQAASHSPELAEFIQKRCAAGVPFFTIHDAVVLLGANQRVPIQPRSVFKRIAPRYGAKITPYGEIVPMDRITFGLTFLHGKELLQPSPKQNSPGEEHDFFDLFRMQLSQRGKTSLLAKRLDVRNQTVRTWKSYALPPENKLKKILEVLDLSDEDRQTLEEAYNREKKTRYDSKKYVTVRHSKKDPTEE